MVCIRGCRHFPRRLRLTPPKGPGPEVWTAALLIKSSLLGTCHLLSVCCCGRLPWPRQLCPRGARDTTESYLCLICNVMFVCLQAFPSAIAIPSSRGSTAGSLESGLLVVQPHAMDEHVPALQGPMPIFSGASPDGSAETLSATLKRDDPGATLAAFRCACSVLGSGLPVLGVGVCVYVCVCARTRVHAQVAPACAVACLRARAHMCRMRVRACLSVHMHVRVSTPRCAPPCMGRHVAPKRT
jgi:hypothetical protein